MIMKSIKITKETFVEDFVETSIAHAKAYDFRCNLEHPDSEIRKREHEAFDENQKMSKQTGNRLRKMSNFLKKDPAFAKETLDKLVELSDEDDANPHVMFSVACQLWAFSYRMDDFDRLCKKALRLMEQGTSSRSAKGMLYSCMKDGGAGLAAKDIGRHRYPKLD